MNEIPNPGDCVVFKRPDGQYDVLKISASGERAYIRSSLASLDQAHAVARGDLETGFGSSGRTSRPAVVLTWIALNTLPRIAMRSLPVSFKG